jgi:hypothetical protein
VATERVRRLLSGQIPPKRGIPQHSGGLQRRRDSLPRTASRAACAGAGRQLSGHPGPARLRSPLGAGPGCEACWTARAGGSTARADIAGMAARRSGRRGEPRSQPDLRAGDGPALHLPGGAMRRLVRKGVTLGSGDPVRAGGGGSPAELAFVSTGAACAKARAGGDMQAIELSSRWEARMTFPNPPVATIRVARITHRDRVLGEQRGDSHRKLCSWWSTCHRW